MKGIGILSIAFATALTVACGGGDTADRTATNQQQDNAAIGTGGDAANNELGFGDKDFVEDQLAAGTAEIELGKLATQKGSTAEVKQFGQMMIDDHTRAGNELKQAVSRFNVTAPAGLEGDHKDLHERLSKLQGAEFDREYMQAMVENHREVVDQLESRVERQPQGTSGDNAQRNSTANQNAQPSAERSDNPATMAVNQWAAKTLPAAQQHLQHAQMLEERFEGNNRSQGQRR